MPKLLLILIAALGGAAIWRRHEIRNDADRASKAITGAAGAAKARIRPGDAEDQEDPPVDGEGGAATAAEDLAESATSAD